MEDENYGVNTDYAHERAKELIPEDFFWNNVDELTPFGSDEGNEALAEFRSWRKEHPNAPTINCLQGVVENIGEMDLAEYNRELLSRETIEAQMMDKDFDDYQYVYQLDVSVIATGFAQLVDEGVIEAVNKPIIQIAINRQIIRAELTEDWEYAELYISYQKVLNRALQLA